MIVLVATNETWRRGCGGERPGNNVGLPSRTGYPAFAGNEVSTIGPLGGVGAGVAVIVGHGAADVGVEGIEEAIVGACAGGGAFVEFLGWGKAVSLDELTGRSAENSNGGGQGEKEGREGNHGCSL